MIVNSDLPTIGQYADGVTSMHKPIASQQGRAARYPADVSPLAGLSDLSPEAFSDLRTLMERDEEVALFTTEPPELTPDWQVTRARQIDQMVYEGAAPEEVSKRNRWRWGYRLCGNTYSKMRKTRAAKSSPSKRYLQTFGIALPTQSNVTSPDGGGQIGPDESFIAD